MSNSIFFAVPNLFGISENGLLADIPKIVSDLICDSAPSKCRTSPYLKRRLKSAEC